MSQTSYIYANLNESKEINIKYSKQVSSSSKNKNINYTNFIIDIFIKKYHKPFEIDTEHNLNYNKILFEYTHQDSPLIQENENILVIKPISKIRKKNCLLFYDRTKKKLVSFCGLFIIIKVNTKTYNVNKLTLSDFNKIMENCLSTSLKNTESNKLTNDNIENNKNDGQDEDDEDDDDDDEEDEDEDEEDEDDENEEGEYDEDEDEDEEDNEDEEDESVNLSDQPDDDDDDEYDETENITQTSNSIINTMNKIHNKSKDLNDLLQNNQKKPRSQSKTKYSYQIKINKLDLSQISNKESFLSQEKKLTPLSKLNEIRIKSINIFKSILSLPLIRQIERGIFNYTIQKCNQKHYTIQWDGFEFKEIYVTKMISLYSNINKNKYVQNKTLLDKIINKTIDPYQLAFMKPYEIYPEKWKPLLDENKRKEEIIKEGQNLMATDRFICPNRKCRARKATYKEVQIRSADEPMTIFLFCLVCGKKWRR